MMRTPACLATLALLAAAPPRAPAQQPPRWTLSAEPLLQIGVVEGDPKYQLFNAVSSALLEDGRLAVLNAGSHELRFYDASGRFLTSAGRKGKGPGEFSVPVRLYREGPDSLVIYDRGNVRFSIHTLDGTFVRTEPAPYERRFAYDEWLYNRSWIDGPELGRARAPVRAAVDRLPMPDPDAGYRYVKVSPQGHLWVRETGRSGAPVDWIVYDIDARPIARIATPPRFEIHEIGRDYLLGTGRDEWDVEYIQLFRMSGAKRAPVHTLAAAHDANANDAPPARAIPQTVLAQMRGTMKYLASLQEMFYSTSGSYASDVRQLEDLDPPDDILVRIVRASTRGWTGIVMDRRTGALCGMTYGAYAPVGWMPGVVTCE